jgi:hypothetical protein
VKVFFFIKSSRIGIVFPGRIMNRWIPRLGWLRQAEADIGAAGGSLKNKSYESGHASSHNRLPKKL